MVRTMKALAASSVGQYERSLHALGDYYRTVELGLGLCFRQQRLIEVESDTVQKDGPVGAIVFGSDQGLVGQFNDRIVEHVLETLGEEASKAQIWAVGERAHARLVDSNLEVRGLFRVPNSVRAIPPLVGQIQIETEVLQAMGPATVYVFHNRPVSGSQYAPAHTRLLPLDLSWQRDIENVDWPTRNLPEVLGGVGTVRALIREYLFMSLFRACAESLASENASRLAAMDRADRNIEEMLSELQAAYHQLRQESIDAELFDVVAGYEALSD